MDLRVLVVVLVGLGLGVDGVRRYYWHSEPYRQASFGLRGDNGYMKNDCPLTCRCIDLSRLGHRDMAERWFSMRRMHGEENTFKGTEAPVWEQEPENLQGREMECIGLDKVPRPIPDNVKRLTLRGDNSNMAGHPGARISFMRENSFENAEGIQQLTITDNNIQILYQYVFINVPNLENLALQNNNISYLSAAAFSRLTNLMELRLSDNMIKYLPPLLFSHLTRLQFLYLNGNKLTNLMPQIFHSLKNLENLDLSRNKFETLADSLFDSVVNLRHLYLNENHIKMIRPRWFEKLSKLQTLEIRGNAITRLDPSSFKMLTNLKALSLSANKINTISDEAFGNLPELRELDLRTNDISKLAPDCFAGLDLLDKLDLSFNRLSFINNKTFTATPELISLDLSHNSINDIEEAALHPLGTLTELDMSYNKLKAIKSKTFTGLMELKEVSLEHNLISLIENDAFIIATIQQQSKLTWLSLQYNRLKELSANSLNGLQNLKFLNLGHNKIKTIHEKAFYNLISLQNLILNDNRISKLEDGLFSRLKPLYSLTLANNKLSVISDKTFSGLWNLDELNLVSNALEEISPKAFRQVTDVTYLRLKNNLLSTFDFEDLVVVKNIREVDLGNNRLYDVKFPEQRTHHIYLLYLTGNQLQTLSSDIVNVMSSNGSVYLDDNPWSCDCRLEWLPRLVSEYRLRLDRSRYNTYCKSPSKLHGMKLTDVELTDFKCDNSTVAEALTCQNLQVRFSTEARAQALRKNKRETRNWHVSFRGGNSSDYACNGMLITPDWVITRRVCSQAFLPYNSSKVLIKVGRKESRQVALSVDHPPTSSVADFDLRLVRLAAKSNIRQEDLPCFLTHAQYHQLSRAIPEAVFTTKVYNKDTKRWRLVAKRGKIQKKCDPSGDMCLRVKSSNPLNIQGSPLSLRYQGFWYFAGLGVTGNSTGAKYQRFTPLWTVREWIATTVHEVDTKCKIHSKKGTTNVLCENLQIEGVVDSKNVLKV